MIFEKGISFASRSIWQEHCTYPGLGCKAKTVPLAIELSDDRLRESQKRLSLDDITEVGVILRG